MSGNGLGDRLARALRPRWSAAAYKAVLVGLLAAAVAVPLVLAGLPFVEFLNDMAAQPKARTQMTHGRTFGRRLIVERAPVAGTIPRDYFPYPFDHLGNEIPDAEEVGRVLANPIGATLEDLRRGRDRYEVYCLPCHGSRGDGDGPVIGPGRFPAPPSLHTEQSRGFADGTIYHMITKGVGQMPPYAWQIAPDDRWRVILYVRALQRAKNPQPGDLEP